MHGSRKFRQWDAVKIQSFDNVFFKSSTFVQRGEWVRASIPKTTCLYPVNKVGHDRSASETQLKWHIVGGPMMAQH